MEDGYRKKCICEYMWLWHNVYICDCGLYTFFLTFILINQETYPFIRRHRVVSLPILLSELPLLNKLSAHSGACFDNWPQWTESPEAVARQRCWLLPPLPQVGAYTCSIVLQLSNLGSVQPPLHLEMEWWNWVFKWRAWERQVRRAY